MDEVMLFPVKHTSYNSSDGWKGNQLHKNMYTLWLSQLGELFCLIDWPTVGVGIGWNKIFMKRRRQFSQITCHHTGHIVRNIYIRKAIAVNTSGHAVIYYKCRNLVYFKHKLGISADFTDTFSFWWRHKRFRLTNCWRWV